MESRGIGLSSVRRVAADGPPKERRNRQSFENPLGRPLRLVGQDRQRRARGQRLERLARAVIEPRVDQQAFVVELEESRQGDPDVDVEPRGLQGAADQQRGPFAHHCRDRVDGQRLAAAFDDERIGRIRQVAPGVDQRAVEIEDNKRQSPNPAAVRPRPGAGRARTARPRGPGSRSSGRRRSCAGRRRARRRGAGIPAGCDRDPRP